MVRERQPPHIGTGKQADTISYQAGPASSWRAKERIPDAEQASVSQTHGIHMVKRQHGMPIGRTRTAQPPGRPMGRPHPRRVPTRALKQSRS